MVRKSLKSVKDEGEQEIKSNPSSKRPRVRTRGGSVSPKKPHTQFDSPSKQLTQESEEEYCTDTEEMPVSENTLQIFDKGSVERHIMPGMISDLHFLTDWGYSDLKEILEVQGIPAVGDVPYKGVRELDVDETQYLLDIVKQFSDGDLENVNSVSHKYLNPLRKTLTEIVRRALVPRSEKRKLSQAKDLILVDLMERKVPINLPGLILKHIEHVISYRSHAFPYGLWLTKIFKDFHINLEGQEVSKFSPKGILGEYLFACLEIRCVDGCLVYVGKKRREWEERQEARQQNVFRVNVGESHVQGAIVVSNVSRLEGDVQMLRKEVQALVVQMMMMEAKLDQVLETQQAILARMEQQSHAQMDDATSSQQQKDGDENYVPAADEGGQNPAVVA